MFRFQCFLEANDLTGLQDRRKKVLFLSNCGSEVIDMAEALSVPTPLHVVLWQTLQESLWAHYVPIPSPMVYKNEFYHQRQEEGETINQYVAALRKSTARCKFSNLEETIMDRLVFGMRDLQLKKKLFSKPKLIFKIALEEARASEAADQTAVAITKTQTTKNSHCT